MELNTGFFGQFPILQTRRLTLRDIRLTDAEEIFRMRSSGRVNQFISREAMGSMDDSVALIQRTRDAFDKHMAVGWAGVLRDGGHIIGTCGFNRFDMMNHRAEIGGELSVEYWGKNIALEAVTEIVRFGLEDIGLHSIEARLSPDNRGAIFLLESLGFRKEAHFRHFIRFRDAWSDMAVYSLVKGDERLEG